MKQVSDSELASLATFARQRWGLVIDEKKRVIVENRLAALRRTTELESVESLIKGLRQGTQPDLELKLFDVLSTNHTHFFREPEQLDLLIRDLIKPARASGRKGLKFWSAGCSKGCEPYSLSILLHEAFKEPSSFEHRILATDLSTTILKEARRGTYSPLELDGVSEGRRKGYFREHVEGSRRSFQVDPKLASVVSFGLLNLLDPWPMKGPFDAILCRNVMIYFDAETRRELAARFLKLLKPGGYLLIGTSETLADFGLDIDVAAASAYRKRGTWA
ncbi:MAG: protein-glutamate O-methyltransferase CheR [Actinomycetales bacterium]|nr:protein-glutamate O-methyltransferase CheR [Actinomycetales bacterium]